MKKLIYKLIDTLKRKSHMIISELIEEINARDYVEVGVWKGDTFFKIADKYPLLNLIGIDDYYKSNYKGYQCGDLMSKTSEEGFENIKADVLDKSMEYDNVKFLFKSSEMAVKGFDDNTLDVVFIDANHSYESVKEDIKLWLPKVRKGGFLCGHDFHLRHFGTIKAVTETLGYNIRVEEDVCIWIYQK